LQEHGWAGLEVAMSGTATTSPRTYTVQTDHYLEFFNPYTKDFIAPPGTTITLYNRASWDAGTYGSLDLPDIDIDVSGKTFPAGKAMVVTTTPTGADPPGLLLNSNVIRVSIPSTLRIFTGTTDQQVTSHGWSPVPYGLKLHGRSGTTHVSDYASEMVWGTANGVFDALGYLGFGGATGSHNIWDYRGRR
jgi:hypothetical protein